MTDQHKSEMEKWLSTAVSGGAPTNATIPTPEIDPLLTTTQTRKLIPVSDVTLWRLEQSGVLVPDARIGRRKYYRQSTLDRFIIVRSSRVGK